MATPTLAAVISAPSVVADDAATLGDALAAVARDVAPLERALEETRVRIKLIA